MADSAASLEPSERLEELVKLGQWFKLKLTESTMRFQKDVVRSANSSEAVVSNLFNGTRLVPKDTVENIAESLGVSKTGTPDEWRRMETLWQDAKVAWQRQDASITQLPLEAGDSGERISALDPAVQSMLQAQYRSREALPYLLFIDRSPPLSELFVEQDIQPDDLRRGIDDSLRAGHTNDAVQSRTISSVLSDHRHLLLTAPPGGGKSTLLHYIAAKSATWWLGHGADEPPFGFVIPVRVAAQLLVGRSLPDAIAASVSAELAEYIDGPMPSSETFTRAALAGCPWLVMIDGLDEILDGSKRAKVIDAVAHHIVSSNEKDSRLRFLLASRQLPPSAASRFADIPIGRFSIQPLDDTRLRLFARAWFAARTAGSGEEKANHFFDIIDRNGLLSIVVVPLLATIALIVAEQVTDATHALSGGRAGLYREFVQYLLHARQVTVQTRSSFRNQLSPYVNGLELSDWIYSHLPELLEYLAVEYLKNDRGELAGLADGWIRDRSPYLPDSIPDWRRVLVDLLCSTGLIIRKGIHLEFLHWSFAEYLASVTIARLMPDSLSRTDVREFISSCHTFGNHARYLFALGRWLNDAEGRTADKIIEALLKSSDSADLQLAADILSYGVHVRREIEVKVANALSNKIRTVESWGYFISSLESLPTRAIARKFLRRLARSAAVEPIARLAAVRSLVNIGDRESAIHILTDMATRKDNGSEHSSYGLLDDDIYFRAEAAWELAHLGATDAATLLLTSLGEEEYRSWDPYNLLYSDVQEFSFWATTGGGPPCFPLLERIAGDFQVEPAVRLSASYAIGALSRNNEDSSKALLQLRSLARDKSIDPLIRYLSIETLFDLKDYDDAEEMISSAVRDSSFTIGLRIRGALLSKKFGGRAAVEKLLVAIVANEDEDLNDRIAAAMNMPGNAGEISIVSDALVETASDSGFDFSERAKVCRCLVVLGRRDLAITIMRRIAHGVHEAGYDRIDAACELAKLFGKTVEASSVLLEMTEDMGLGSSVQEAALAALSELEVGYGDLEIDDSDLEVDDDDYSEIGEDYPKIDDNYLDTDDFNY